MTLTPSLTPKQRMLRAYRGERCDRAPVAPEFWYYYPAKLLGVDMLEFSREVPFHQALKQTFETFDCDGWGIDFPAMPNPQVSGESTERWVSEGRLEIRSVTHTPAGDLTSGSMLDREEPGWVTERPIKDLARDLPAFEVMSLPDPDLMDVTPLVKAWEEVGESYLLEAFLGVPFFDYYAGSREGGLQQGIFDLLEQEQLLEGLRQRHLEHMVHKTRVICERTPLESLFIGCSWSCNSLLGPRLWRQWDIPVIAAVVEEAHRHGRLVHIHLHGRVMETVADVAALGVDCCCPFERPPGGDVEGLAGLEEVARLLEGKVTMNGNIHTVETLIRGTEADVRQEVAEVWEAFGDSDRVIIGTGDQVGRETPEENLWAMIDEAKRRCVPG
jgi:hypothetical protein